MKITLEIEPQKDPTPLLVAMDRIKELVDAHYMSGDSTAASSELVDDIKFQLTAAETYRDAT